MLPESSLLDRHTSETVAARLLDHRSAPASSKARWPSSSPKPAAKGSSSPEARASGIPGPVTLVVPLVTADGDEGRVASDAADTGGGGGAGEESNLGVSSWMRQRGLKDVGTADSRADAAAERKGTGSKPPVGEGIAAAPLRMSFVRPVGGGWPADLAIGRARKLDTRAGNANTKRVGMNERAADENSGQERERDATAIADRREAEWIRNVLMSGPTVPGLVVDLWSPGAMFLRHVEVSYSGVSFRLNNAIRSDTLCTAAARMYPNYRALSILRPFWNPPCHVLAETCLAWPNLGLTR